MSQITPNQFETAVGGEKIIIFDESLVKIYQYLIKRKMKTKIHKLITILI